VLVECRSAVFWQNAYLSRCYVTYSRRLLAYRCAVICYVMRGGVVLSDISTYRRMTSDSLGFELTKSPCAPYSGLSLRITRVYRKAAECAVGLRMELDPRIVQQHCIGSCTFIGACTEPSATLSHYCKQMNRLAFQVITAVIMKSSLFLDITPCSPLKVGRRFGGTCPIHL
jgi:hypothetical protein